MSYVKHVDEYGGILGVEHALYNCINRIIDGVKRLKVLKYSDTCQKS